VSGAQSFAAPPPAIATKAELDQLRASRPAPAPAMHLTPDGPAAVDVRQRLDAMHAQRIDQLQNRLQQVRDGLERDHALGQLQDRAKADFGRSR